MSLHQNVPTPLTLADNPWTNGLKFFTVLEGIADLRNYVLPGTGTFSSSTLTPPIPSITGYPGLYFRDVNGDVINWDRASLGTMTGAVTVIARWLPRSGALGSALGTWEGNAGFSLLFVSGTFGAEDGIEMIVGETGTNLLISSGSHASYEDIEATVGGRYNSNTKTVDIWQNGVKLATNTDTGKSWNSTPVSNLATGIILGTSQNFEGSVFWIAYFDRALTDEEMVVWTTQDPLELILPAPDMMPAPGDRISCANVILVTDEAAGENTYSITTALFAGADLAGDMNSDPPVPPIFSGRNEVLVIGVTNTVETVLMSTRNTVLVTDAADTFEPFSAGNVVLVGGRPETRIGNQLVAGRYRR